MKNLKKFIPYSCVCGFVLVLCLLKQYIQARSWQVSNYEIMISYKRIFQIGFDLFYFLLDFIFWVLLADIFIRFHSSMKRTMVFFIQCCQKDEQYKVVKKKTDENNKLLNEVVENVIDRNLKSDDISETIKKSIKELDEINSHISEEENKIKKEKKELLKEFGHNVVNSFKEANSNLILFVLIVLSLWLKEDKMNFSFDYLVKKNLSLYLFLLLLVVELLLCVRFFLKNRTREPSTILQTSYFYFPIKKNFKEIVLNVPNYFTAEFVCKHFYTILFCVIILVGQTILPIFYIQTVRTFQVVTKDDNEQYAVVYMAGDNFYCKKIEIDGDNAVIYLENQFITNSQLNTREMTFKNVTVLKKGCL